MTWQFVSDTGSRSVNEDHVRIIQHGDLTCFVLADGLGGHGKGEVASALVGDTFDLVCQSHNLPLDELLSTGLEETQKALIAEQQKSGNFFQAKTTACVLLVRGGHLMWGHIGDSRLYAFARNKIKERTLDHSVPQMLVMSKEIKEKHIRNHPDRNRLLRVLGVANDTPRFALSPLEETAKFQGFLLCSDGFWELIVEKEMCSRLKKSTSVDQWLEQMCDIVKGRGDAEMDNFSAIAIWV